MSHKPYRDSVPAFGAHENVKNQLITTASSNANIPNTPLQQIAPNRLVISLIIGL